MTLSETCDVSNLYAACTLRRVLAMFYDSAEDELIWMKSGAFTLSGAAWTDFGRDPRSSDSWSARRNSVFFVR